MVTDTTRSTWNTSPPNTGAAGSGSGVALSKSGALTREPAAKKARHEYGAARLFVRTMGQALRHDYPAADWWNDNAIVDYVANMPAVSWTIGFDARWRTQMLTLRQRHLGHSSYVTLLSTCCAASAAFGLDWVPRLQDVVEWCHCINGAKFHARQLVYHCS